MCCIYFSLRVHSLRVVSGVACVVYILPSEYILSELYLELHVLYVSLRVHSLGVVFGVL